MVAVMNDVKKETANQHITRKATELIFPVNCLVCNAEGDWFCPKCLVGLTNARMEQCAICGAFTSTGICNKCQKATKLDGIICLSDYHDQNVKALIKKIKYANHHDGCRIFGQKLQEKTKKHLPKLDFSVTFVPLEASRQTNRGFNQAEVLANSIFAQSYPIVCLFSKNKMTVPQASLDKKARAENLKGAFSLKKERSALKPWQQKTVIMPNNLIIVDDVVTTGATLSALAKLAKKNGTKTVWAVTIAHD